MITIWKYELPYDVEFTLDVPRDAQILKVETQYTGPSEKMTMWALVDTDAEKETRHFRLGGTGGPLPDNYPGHYRGTCQLNGGTLVFHVFEEIAYD